MVRGAGPTRGLSLMRGRNGNGAFERLPDGEEGSQPPANRSFQAPNTGHRADKIMAVNEK